MKGSLQDIPVIVAVLLATAVAVMTTYLWLGQFFAMDLLTDNPVTATVGTTGLSAMVILGNAFIFIFFGFGIAAIISSFYTETHPVFFVFSIIVFACCVMVVGIFSDVFVEFASTGVMLPVAAEFVLMVDTMINLPKLSVILGVIILVALYAKRTDLQIGGGQA